MPFARPRMLAAAAIASFVAWCGVWTAQAHHWYPRECCGDGDCAVASELVHLAGGRLRITTPQGSVEVPRDFPVQASPDGHAHACLRRGEYDDGDSGWMVICLFLPPEV